MRKKSPKTTSQTTSFWDFSQHLATLSESAVCFRPKAKTGRPTNHVYLFNKYTWFVGLPVFALGRKHTADSLVLPEMFSRYFLGIFPVFLNILVKLCIFQETFWEHFRIISVIYPNNSRCACALIKSSDPSLSTKVEYATRKQKFRNLRKFRIFERKVLSLVVANTFYL